MSSSPIDSPDAAGTVEVTMPQMGVSVVEGTIVVWHKQPGDWVNADETICEIATDKIDSDVPSPAAGRLLEILVEPDQTVPVGTALARIATDAVAGEAHPDEQAAGPHRHYSPVVQRIARLEGIDLELVLEAGEGAGSESRTSWRLCRRCRCTSKALTARSRRSARANGCRG